LCGTANMSGDNDKEFMTGPEDDRGLAVEEAKPKVRKPPLFKVLLLNDDYTPMEFVVEVLQLIFGMDRPQATRVMLEVHTQGKGVCGIFTYEIAETKVAQVCSFADQHQHPLLCTLEETE
jgi:ATP-dependent Clp protease adaptor protein ClpS